MSASEAVVRVVMNDRIDCSMSFIKKLSYSRIWTKAIALSTRTITGSGLMVRAQQFPNSITQLFGTEQFLPSVTMQKNLYTHR